MPRAPSPAPKIKMTAVEYEKLVRKLADRVWDMWYDRLRSDRERRGRWR